MTSILGSREQLYNIAILGRVFAQILSAVITEMFSLLNTTNLPLTSKPFTINSLAGGGGQNKLLERVLDLSIYPSEEIKGGAYA